MHVDLAAGVVADDRVVRPVVAHEPESGRGHRLVVARAVLQAHRDVEVVVRTGSDRRAARRHPSRRRPTRRCRRRASRSSTPRTAAPVVVMARAATRSLPPAVGSPRRSSCGPRPTIAAPTRGPRRRRARSRRARSGSTSCIAAAYTLVVAPPSRARISAANGSDDVSSVAISRASWGWRWNARTERWKTSVSRSTSVVPRSGLREMCGPSVDAHAIRTSANRWSFEAK